MMNVAAIRTNTENLKKFVFGVFPKTYIFFGVYYKVSFIDNVNGTELLVCESKLPLGVGGFCQCYVRKHLIFIL